MYIHSGELENNRRGGDGESIGYSNDIHYIHTT